MIECLEGPIVVFGAGGFIGANLLSRLLRERQDVIGISQAPRSNWRLTALKVRQENLMACDINEATLLFPLLQEVRPRTVFMLSAYGAYSKQKEYRKTYRTNFNAVVDVLEALKPLGFSALVQAGSSSEYGLNPEAPGEDDELRPNSHYAVSKVASYYALKYYGQVEELPVIHLRLYSTYGPWEEPDRLVPQLLAHARRGSYPKLVHPETSRDFVHVDDVCQAFIQAALVASQHKGKSYNIGSGQKTTLRELTTEVARIFSLSQAPVFGTMPNRDWDVKDWYANPEKAAQELNWRGKLGLRQGLEKTAAWQLEADFDRAPWNWTQP